jgi:hypothetical protein
MVLIGFSGSEGHRAARIHPTLSVPQLQESDLGYRRHDFQETRKPLLMWFRAMWYVTSQKNRARALGLQRVPGLGSYETAWTWLHRLRRAMVRPDRDRLRGWIEVDETFIGGLAEGALGGRQKNNKGLVVIAVQAGRPAIGRIRMWMIADASADSLHPFVIDCIEPGSTCTLTAGRAMRGWKRSALSERSP